MASGCPVCGNPVVQADRGRPRRWCSDACKRTRERAVEHLAAMHRNEPLWRSLGRRASADFLRRLAELEAIVTHYDR